MSQKEPEVGELWDDNDLRTNRRVKVINVVDPYGSKVKAYVEVENVGGSRALVKDVPPPSPIGRVSIVRRDRFVRYFTHFDPTQHLGEV